MRWSNRTLRLDLKIALGRFEPRPEPAPRPEPKGEARTRVHPKCAFPGCDRNRFVHGHGYCGKHWKRWKRGELPDAGAVHSYRKVVSSV